MEKLIVVLILMLVYKSKGSYLENNATHIERICQEILASRFSPFNTYCLSEHDSCMEMLPNLTHHFVFKHATEIPALIEFIKHLPSIEVSIIAHHALYEDFSHFYLLETQYLVQLMLLVKQTMQKSQFESLNETYKNLYSELKTKFPPKLTTLIWSEMSNCTISNVLYENEFLYLTSAWHNFGTTHRANYLWKYEDGEVDDTAIWRLNQHADKLQLINKHYWTFCLTEGGPLMTSQDNPESCADFYLHPVDEVFQMSRESDSDFVIAGEVLNHRRRVKFVNKAQSEDNASLWNISCSEQPEAKRRFY